MSFLEITYVVNLINGSVSAGVRGGPDGPYASFDNIHQADYCSLGISIQNMGENAFKSDAAEIDQAYTRTVLGTKFTETIESAREHRIRLYEEKAEYFV